MSPRREVDPNTNSNIDAFVVTHSHYEWTVDFEKVGESRGSSSALVGSNFARHKKNASFLPPKTRRSTN